MRAGVFARLMLLSFSFFAVPAGAQVYRTSQRKPDAEFKSEARDQKVTAKEIRSASKSIERDAKSVAREAKESAKLDRVHEPKPEKFKNAEKALDKYESKHSPDSDHRARVYGTPGAGT